MAQHLGVESIDEVTNRVTSQQEVVNNPDIEKTLHAGDKIHYRVSAKEQKNFTVTVDDQSSTFETTNLEPTGKNIYLKLS